MGIDVVPLRFCASWWGEFRVRSTNPRTPHINYTVRFYGGEQLTTCSCPAFEHRKECKHVELVMKLGCFWNEQWCEGHDALIKPQSYTIHEDALFPIPMTKKNKPKKRGPHVCPHCKGRTVVVRCAV